MTRDAVTVIIPTRHRPSFLTTTVRSIQTAVSETDRKQGPRVRILVCDDAPESDDTRAASAALGVDYAAPTGTPVRTIGDGVVSFAGWQNGYGNIIEIRHKDNQLTKFAHLSRIDVGAGDAVTAFVVLASRAGETHRVLADFQPAFE